LFFTFFKNFNAVFKVQKYAFWQQELGFGILPYDYLEVLKVSRKSEAAC